MNATNSSVGQDAKAKGKMWRWDGYGDVQGAVDTAYGTGVQSASDPIPGPKRGQAQGENR